MENEEINSEYIYGFNTCMLKPQANSISYNYPTDSGFHPDNNPPTFLSTNIRTLKTHISSSINISNKTIMKQVAVFLKQIKKQKTTTKHLLTEWVEGDQNTYVAILSRDERLQDYNPSELIFKELLSVTL